MEMKMSDFLDRWTILQMKARFDENAKKELAIYDKELLETFKKDQAEVRPSTPEAGLVRTHSLYFLKSILELMESNGKIWEHEAGIRNEFNKDPANQGDQTVKDGVDLTQEQLAEIGRKTLRIRELNKMRVNAKKKIDTIFGQIPDTKVSHQSA